MKKVSRLPHEQAIENSDDGLGLVRDVKSVGDDQDVEGHRAGFLPGLPGTGGDEVRRPSGGGEIDGEDDVEGHLMGHTKGERLRPGMPGTGGDER